MFKNILLPTDGSKISQEAIKEGIKLAKSLGSKVTGVYVSPKFSFFDLLELSQEEKWGQHEIEKAKQSITHYENLHKSFAEKHLTFIKDEAKKESVECETVFVPNESAAEGILKVAKDKKCDLIFIASHGLGVTAALLGSVTLKVLSHSHIPVLVYRK